PAKEVHAELAKCPKVHVKNDPRQSTEQRPKHARPEANTADAVNVVDEADRKQRVKLAEEDDFPAVFLNRLIQMRPLRTAAKNAFDPLPPQLSPDEESACRSDEAPR